MVDYCILCSTSHTKGTSQSMEVIDDYEYPTTVDLSAVSLASSTATATVTLSGIPEEEDISMSPKLAGALCILVIVFVV